MARDEPEDYEDDDDLTDDEESEGPDVGEPDALVTDRVEDTIDYGEVCQVIALVAQQRSYKTLERLCAVIADRLATQFGADHITVKASKPEPPIPLPLEEVSVEVWREGH